MSISRSARAVLSITIGIRGMECSLVGCLRQDDRAALEGAGSEVGERLFGVVQRVGGDRGADRDLRGQLEELLAVLASQIGDRPDAPLVPQVFVGEARDV